MSFRFKKFSIHHDSEVFKFGTDAALLATWCNIEKSSNFLEIGIGSGVITLMLAQRKPEAKYVGIDISELSVEVAEQNLANYPIHADIDFSVSSLQNFETDLMFDHIVSNPPFFDNGTKSPSELKNLTRHTDTLELVDLLTYSKALLSPNGLISIIYPVRYLDNIYETCKNLGLFIQKVSYTRATILKPVKRVLVTISIQPSELFENELIINGDESGYSKEVFDMFQPFLLKL
jgi:tRNA1Val (adenine37-N6)-methyltransferase